MNILVIDAIFNAVSVLACGKNGVYSSSFYPSSMQRGRELQNLIQIATKEAGFAVHETEIVAVPEGPGGFTGLRLGYSVAKAVSLASGADVLAIPTLTILEASQHFYDGMIVSLIDAKRDCFFFQVFASHVPITEIYDASILQLIPCLEGKKEVLVVGIGLEKFKTTLQSEAIASLVFPRIHMVEVSQSAFPKYILDYVLNNRHLCKVLKDCDGPLYVRKSDAERG